MKKLIFAFITVCCFTSKAQQPPNPYSSIGKPAPKIATLSNGEYEEFFIKDSVILINGDIVSRATGETVYSVEEDTVICAQIQQREEDKFRFLSVDPMTADYPHYTPYQFAGNEPIAAIDLDGAEPAYLKPNGGYVTARDGALQRPLSQQGQDYITARKGSSGGNVGAFVSAGLDLIPVVGTVKNYVEAASGNDLITGEEIPNWVRVASIVPYGKFSKYLKHADDVIEQTSKHAGDVVNTTKKVVEKEVKNVTNPYGKKGGPAHQKTVDDAEQQLIDQGFQTKREVKVNTPGGNKNTRYIDVQGTKSNGDVKSIQVGKQNKNGTPVSREKKALDDIENSTGKRPEFVPYNKPKQ